MATEPSDTVPGGRDKLPEPTVPVSTDGSSTRPGEHPADGSTALLPTEDKGRRRATRVADGAWLGGVCTGLAAHLGWPVMVIRIGFVALTLLQFIGAVVYAVLWLTMPPAPTEEKAPGLESASRSNMRPGKRRHGADVGAVVALGLFGTGLLWLVQGSGLGVSQKIFWPLAFAGAGVALVWRTADNPADTDGKDWRRETEGRVWLAPLVARGRLLSLARIIFGMALVGAAVGMVIASQAGLAEIPRILGMAGLALAGIGLVIAPWAYRSRIALQTAREEKVRADARADMAAHLHDSVLQTLALIQKRADEPKTVATLARKQERELRTWLYGDEIREQTLKAGLAAAAAEIEDERGVPIEVVCVGDLDLDERMEALLRATREAMMNAAKHSGAARIDVYAEVDDEFVEIFVRDRGRGFDINAIGDDRMGVKGSIIGRMERHGGKARIRSSAEDGTEVKLEMSR
ncbi:ATP-binding protein [Enemella evansiae]|uniref:Histidine kinase n=1 Tax=Enemella evansiae TaxID=2016499 RepID=A0A255GC35_9ACTN|nr:ATP-binding protein [Enemella evansiae]OYN95572.1 histidine kinase [Enemella evansiae]OYO00333.1 histidine kinase [Enemella evansiae]OYO03677.1 histidine kinase [Enemella evansiae]OYO10105.1 histidine kinase [Enemella evansiae]OYO10278.1 histidine kinase [Enemella evansiae]